MSTIRPQQFASRPVQHAAVGTLAPEPQSSVAPYQATPAYTQNDGRAMAALGATLGNFFGRAAQTAQDVGQTLHEQEMVEIGRENEALANQAVVDQKTGQSPNPEHMTRRAYASTFKTAAADATAFEMAEDLKDHMADMPLDGSVNPRVYAEQYYREQTKGGSGDPEYDARLLYSFAKSVEGEVGRHNAAIQETQEAQVLQTIHQDTARTLQQQQGITGGQMAELFQRTVVAARGNTVVANKHFTAMLGKAIQNDGQALSVLNGLQASGWAESNPADYLKLSQDAHTQTNKVKTWQAGTDVQGWHQDFAVATAQARAAGRVLGLDEVHAFRKRAQDIDGRHGVGAAAFQGWEQALAQASKQSAGVNFVVAAYRGLLGGSHDGALVAAAAGEEPGKLMTKYFDPAVAQIAREDQGAFPNLVRSIGALGLVNPLASSDAAREFGALLSNKNMQTAAPGGMSDTYKSMLGNALMGTDPEAQATAFMFFKTYEDLAGPAMAARLFSSPEAATRFGAVSQMTKLQMSPDAAFKRLNQNPEEVKAYVADAGGQIDWRKVTGKPDIKPFEFQADLTSKVEKTMRESVGRDAWFGAPRLILGAREEDMMLGLAAMNMRDQFRVSGSVDADAAAAEVVKQMKNRFVTLPGQGNTMQLIADPYGGRGRVVSDPVNVVNGKKVYAGFPIKNLLNKIEDPIATYRKDLESFSKVLPGLVADGEERRVSLAPPDAISGLHQVMLPSMMPLTVGPGQRVAMPFDTTKNIPFHAGPDTTWDISYKTAELREVTLPTDPKELNDFLVKHLPPGFHPVAGLSSPDGRQRAYSIQYGFRVVGDEVDVQRRLKEGEARIDEANRRRAALRSGLPAATDAPAIFYPSVRPKIAP